MRKTILTAVLAGLLAMPVLAQFPFRGGVGRGIDGTMLLSSKDVQKELKLTEEQSKAIAAANEARTKAFRQAFQDKDREAMQKAGEEFNKAIAKVKDGLSPAQSRRLSQIEVQLAVRGNQPTVFKRPDVQKGLRLTEKQQDTIKETLTDLEKDTKEVMEDARGDREKFRSAFTKIQAMNKETYAKITKSLTEDQKTALKELQGDEFKGQLFSGFGGRGPGERRPGKDRKREKKDDI